MDYGDQYIQYKTGYLELINIGNHTGNQMGGDKKVNIILIVGYGASGKSYLSKQYAEKGYFVISGDKIIRDHLMICSIDEKHFGIYAEKTPEELIPSRNKFIEIVKGMIGRHSNIVIEGQFKNNYMIQEMIGKNDLTMIFTKPKSKKSYIEHLTNRFVEDPANYGRVGILTNLDGLIDRVGLNDYIRNGVTGKYIKKLIRDAANARYHKHQELLEFYKKKYKNLIVRLT